MFSFIFIIIFSQWLYFYQYDHPNVTIQLGVREKPFKN